jgi:hypothetical protein
MAERAIMTVKVNCSLEDLSITKKKEDEVTPTQAWAGPEGTQEIEAPRSQENR